MADVSLHYRSQAPLAGTFEVLGRILATWRRRAVSSDTRNCPPDDIQN